MDSQTIAILTGGGDSSGINALLHAIVYSAETRGWKTLGFHHGWRGLIENSFSELHSSELEESIGSAGTLLGTSRTNPFKLAGSVEKIKANIAEHGITALIAVGGDDTLGVASQLAEKGLQVVGIPQTVDNDIYGTEYCLGYDTALNQVLQAVDAMLPSNRSHQKDMVVEIMGREAGWITLAAAIALKADYTAIPEQPLDFDHMMTSLQAKKARGNKSLLVLIAEGVEVPGFERTGEADAFGHKPLEGIGQALANRIKQETGWDLRHQVLGFIQRGGRATAFEMRNSVEMGQEAVRLIEAGETGLMVARHAGRIAKVPITEIRNRQNSLPESMLKMATEYGCFG